MVERASGDADEVHALVDRSGLAVQLDDSVGGLIAQANELAERDRHEPVLPATVTLVELDSFSSDRPPLLQRAPR